jgi:tRNA A-37 threonylcarbamoyl transferase component Bud32
MKFTPDGLAAVGHDLLPPFLVDLCLDPSDDLAAQTITELTFLSVARVLPGRRVSGLAEHEGQTVFAKLFYGKRARRYWQRELAGAARIARTGIKTPVVLNKGATADGNGYVVFYEALPDPGNLRDDDIEDILATVQILGRLHDANLVQSDAHIFNFLRARGDYYAIDAGGIRTAYLLRQQFANLGMLMAQRAPLLDRDIDEVWSVYAAARGAYVSRMGSAQMLRKLTLQQREARVRRYLKKTQRDCAEFVQHQSFKHNFLCDRGHWHLLQRFMLFPEVMVGEGTPLKLGNSATVVRIQVDGQSYVVKRYNIKGWAHRIRRWFKRRARDAWCNGQMLAFLDIDTAKPIALLEQKWGWCRGVCYLVMPDCGERNLGQELASHPERFANYADATIDLLQRLAAAGLQHGDLKATNFVLTQNRVVLIDYDAVQAGAPDRDIARFLNNWADDAQLQARWSEALAERLGSANE